MRQKKKTKNVLNIEIQFYFCCDNKSKLFIKYICTRFEPKQKKIDK